MTEPVSPPNEQLDGWPPEGQRMASVALVHALGQISLSYNLLERMLGDLLKRITPFSEDYTTELFEKLHNADRIRLIREIARNAAKQDQKASDAIHDCIGHYEICTSNRNILSHAMSEGVVEGGLTKLTKNASKNPGRRIEFHVSVEDIKMVAEQMSACFNFMWDIDKYLRYRDLEPEDRPQFLPRALPETPQKPKILEIHQRQ